MGLNDGPNIGSNYGPHIGPNFGPNRGPNFGPLGGPNNEPPRGRKYGPYPGPNYGPHTVPSYGPPIGLEYGPAEGRNRHGTSKTLNNGTSITTNNESSLDPSHEKETQPDDWKIGPTHETSMGSHYEAIKSSTQAGNVESRGSNIDLGPIPNNPLVPPGHNMQSRADHGTPGGTRELKSFQDWNLFNVGLTEMKANNGFTGIVSSRPQHRSNPHLRRKNPKIVQVRLRLKGGFPGANSIIKESEPGKLERETMNR